MYPTDAVPWFGVDRSVQIFSLCGLRSWEALLKAQSTDCTTDFNQPLSLLGTCLTFLLDIQVAFRCELACSLVVLGILPDFIHKFFHF